MTLDIAFRESDLVPPGPDDPVKDAMTVRSYLADSSRVSIQPDGTIALRPNNAPIGEWERAYRRGNKLFWFSTQYPTGCYVALIAEGL